MKRVAIIGTGISGLGTAYLIHQHYDITVYEQEGRPGGHARTKDVQVGGKTIPVDTGFIVFNYRNYPLLTGLFKELDVPVAKSDMSLGLSLGGGRFEWGCQTLNAVFGQRSNIVKPRFWGMIRDIMRFNKMALETVGDDKTLTLAGLLDRLRMGDDFCHRFLLPTAGAIWSSSPEQILDFPAYAFVNFFHNHGLLTVNDQPQWYTVDGGSREYVSRITAPFAHKIRYNAAVASVDDTEQGLSVTTKDGDTQYYDHVVIATHSDQALRMLANPTKEEQAVLGDIPYQNNRAYLHADQRLMPKRRACWASWNYLTEDMKDERSRITVTYWMNRLQNISNDMPLFVTLNPPHAPKEELIYDEYMFEHPVYNLDMLQAQERIESIQGKRGIWFCGAYQRYGFHEDGFSSGVNVAKQLGCDISWS